MRFLQRSQFDEIQYGSAMQKRHARQYIAPGYRRARSFQTAQPAVSGGETHVIAHECFYAARRSLPGRRFSSAARRSMVCGRRDKEPSQPGSVAATGKTHHGWWQNSWQRWTQEENQKMVCRLAGTAEENAFLPDLAASRRFTIWLKNRPAFAQSALYSAGRVTQIVVSLVQEYNATLTAAAPGG